MDSAQPKKYEAGARMPTIDPVCGMTVDRQNAAGSFEHNRLNYFFCSLGCREKFKADPERYRNQNPESSTAQPVQIGRLASNDPVATARGSDTSKSGQG